MADKIGSEADVIAENATLKAELEKAKTEKATAESDLALEKTAHAKTKTDLDAAVADRDKTKADLTKVQTDLAAVTKERDELKAKDMDVDQRAAAKIVQFGIRDTRTQTENVQSKAKTVTEMCREAAEQAKTAKA